jgi:hypothetical protein
MTQHDQIPPADDKFSGRFQVRMSSDLHRDLSNFAAMVGLTMNETIELALDYNIRQNKSAFFDYVVGVVREYTVVFERDLPLCTLTRRNVICYRLLSEDVLEITSRKKVGSVWKQVTVEARISDNHSLRASLIAWNIPVDGVNYDTSPHCSDRFRSGH